MRGLSGMESAAGQDEPEALIREAGERMPGEPIPSGRARKSVANTDDWSEGGFSRTLWMAGIITSPQYIAAIS